MWAAGVHPPGKGGGGSARPSGSAPARRRPVRRPGQPGGSAVPRRAPAPAPPRARPAPTATHPGRQLLGAGGSPDWVGKPFKSPAPLAGWPAPRPTPPAACLAGRGPASCARGERSVSSGALRLRRRASVHLRARTPPCSGRSRGRPLHPAGEEGGQAPVPRAPVGQPARPRRAPRPDPRAAAATLAPAPLDRRPSVRGVG